MKAIKKACSGTSLYPKKSSVSSKLKTGGKIKKAQNSDTIPSKKSYENSPFQMAKQQMAKANNNKEIIKKSTDEANKKFLDKSSKKKNGGSVKAKDGKWIQKAINPKHKGFCTPETKATCTPKRKALAHTLRKIAKKK
jgi:hypothetical protein